MRKLKLISIVLLALLPALVSAEPPAKAKNLMLDVALIPEENIEVFEVEGKRFRTVELLKKYLDQQEAGTTVTWDPGCVRFGDKPLLSTGVEIKSLRSYLEKRGLKFVVIP